MNKIIFLKFILIALMLSSCGKGVVDPSNNSYEPKIVIEGFLIANQKADKIKIARNFPIGTNLRQSSLIPAVNQTTVLIYDLENGTPYSLKFHEPEDKNFDNYYWYYDGNDFIIKPGKRYKLEVSAVIDNKPLTAYAETTVPNPGCEITKVNYDTLRYREKDDNGNLKYFRVDFERSPGTSFYIMTAYALNHRPESYIYENPYNDLDPEDVAEDADDFNINWLQNAPLDAGESYLEFFWYNFEFYGDYEMILFAADENYRKFIQTYDEVQEPDGNFHEAKLTVEGDGIGVFGSMIADTVYVNVKH